MSPQRRTFSCTPGDVPAARRFVRETLEGQPAGVVEAAEVMTSELATNAIRHAQTGFEITIDVGEELRVEVRDDGAGEPTPRTPELREPTGRGLLIVHALAADWGVIPGASGKTVWFTLAGVRSTAGRAR